jgi:putative transposase
MTAKPLALLYADLGIAQSLARPRTPDDNPFSEAQFKTVKYHPTFPERFGSLLDASVPKSDFARTYALWEVALQRVFHRRSASH